MPDDVPLVDCASCCGKGWKDDYQSARLCYVCDGTGYDLDGHQRAMIAIVRRLLQAQAEVNRRSFQRF
jgi:serine/threonine protein phosphatase PrpC